MHDGVAAVAAAQYRLDSGIQGSSTSGPDVAGDNSSMPHLSARDFVQIVIEARSNPSPEPKDVFPWLHGISPDNQFAAQFLKTRYPEEDVSTLLSPPQNSTGILLVKCGDIDDNGPTIRGSVTIQDILARSDDNTRFLGQFLKCELHDGLQLRSFLIQPIKFAQICDIIVYTSQPYSGKAEKAQVLETGRALAELVREAQSQIGLGRRTFFFSDTIDAFLDELNPQLASALLLEPERNVVDLDIKSFENRPVVWENGLPEYETLGIASMSSASEVLPRVWLGNYLDIVRMRASVDKFPCQTPPSSAVLKNNDHRWQTVVTFAEFCSEPPTLALLDNLVRQNRRKPIVDEKLVLQFPCFGEIVIHGLDSRTTAYLITMCKLLYIRSKRHEVFIASNDGYHLSSPFATILVMYCRGLTMGEALLYLHRDCHRPVSLSMGEMIIVRDLEPVIYALSPVRYSPRTRELGAVSVTLVKKVLFGQDNTFYSPPIECDRWLMHFPGAFPSRILDHLYLGSSEHAENPDMLRALGINRLLSVGETVSWLQYPINDEQVKELGFNEVFHVSNLQDDGVDGLLQHLPACLDFLARSEQQGYGATLVHCRKGVSRSAAVCIAEVMRSKKWGLPQAYAHVRVNRLDVIIQPNLKLIYDLLKFEERAPFLDGRTVDWPILSREIARLNRDYLY